MFLTTAWILIAFYFLGYVTAAAILYRQGTYVKKRYPTRYANQLTPPNAGMARLGMNPPFPFNSGVGTDRYGTYSRQFQKIIDIAQSEHDEDLLNRASWWYRLSLFSPKLFLGLVLLLFVILVLLG